MTDSAFPDNFPIPICCPQCGHKSQKMLRGLKNKPRFPCPSCGKALDTTEMIAKVTAGIEASVKKLKDTIAKCNRRMR